MNASIRRGSSVLVAALVTTLSTSAGAQQQQPPAEATPAQEPPAGQWTTIEAPPLPPEPAPPAAPATGGSGAEGEKPPEPLAGFKKYDGFRIKSEDGQYSLRVGLQSGTKIEPLFLPADTKPQLRQFFEYLRPKLDGWVFREWIKYWTSLEFANQPPYVLDSYIEISPTKAAQLRFGQFWTPLSRHEYYGPQEILFPEWSMQAEYYWTGRDKGLLYFGSILDGKVDYYLGAFAGTPQRQPGIIPGSFDFQGRVTFNPMGPCADTEMPFISSKTGEVPFRLSFTAQGVWNRTATPVQTLNPSNGLFVINEISGSRHAGTAAADIWVQGGRFSLLAEGYYRQTNPENDGPQFTSYSAWGQASYIFYKKELGAAVRVGWLDPSTTLANDRSVTAEAQLAWYIDWPYIYLRLRYGYFHQQDPGPGDFGQVSIPLPVGTSHLVTLQATLAI